VGQLLAAVISVPRVYRFFHELMILMIRVMRVRSWCARMSAVRRRCRFAALLRNHYPLASMMQASAKMTFTTPALLSSWRPHKTRPKFKR
jgi:hypothetical protein